VDKAVVIFKHPQSKIANKKLIHRKLEACIHTQSTQHTNNKAQKLTKIKYRGMCSRHHTKHTNNKAKKSHPEKKQHQGSHSTIYQPTNQPQRQHSSLPSFPRYAPASLLITPNPPIYIHTATLISRASLPSRAHNRQATLTKDTKNERKKKEKYVCSTDSNAAKSK
jgi:hypothetical protein